MAEFKPKVPLITHDCNMSYIMQVAIKTYLKYYKNCLMINSKTRTVYWGLPNTAYHAKRASDMISGTDSHHGGNVHDVNACIACLFFYFLQAKNSYTPENDDVKKTFLYITDTLLKLMANLQGIPEKDKANVKNTINKCPAPKAMKYLLIQELKGKLPQ